jgi:glycogen operon protein
MAWRIKPGRAEPLGATADTQGGVNFAVVSSVAEAVFVCPFDTEGRELARLRLPARSGDVHHGRILGLHPGDRYGLRVEGPWRPASGHRCDAAKLLVDPYAMELDAPFRLHKSLFGHGADTAAVVPKAIIQAPATLRPPPPPPHQPAPLIYELHVRGFTKRHPAIPQDIRGTFAALAHPAAIEHLQKLGVTIVEVMPSAAWVDERYLGELGLPNYWGYNPVALLAPDPRLAPGGMKEVRAATGALRKAGIATILDVVFNHTGEGDEFGPVLSLRGIDNALYHRLWSDDASLYVNDSGCGNTLALDRPAPLRLAMDAMRHWVTAGGMDGFRLDLAATLGRRDHGFDPAAPLLSAMAQDPLLRERIIIAEPWDIGPGGYRLGQFPAAWGEWNDRFRDAARRFWRGDAGMVGELATRLAGSADFFHRRPITCSVNYLAAHDGFTLADLVSHERKHNLANGEGNRDGSDNNHSWNNGVEGATRDPAILGRRAADIRALLLTLLCARGTPMLGMGDECGRSQSGNNNAYAQDNATTWFDWEGMDQDLLAFSRRLVALRREHPALHDGQPLSGTPRDGAALPDVAWLQFDGTPMTRREWEERERRSLALALHEKGGRVLVALHAGDAPASLTPPPPRRGLRWELLADSADPTREGPAPPGPLRVAPRSALLLAEAPL